MSCPKRRAMARYPVAVTIDGLTGFESVASAMHRKSDEAAFIYQVLLFEGWCVGARPQPAQALLAPVNALEEAEDPQGIWRRYANEALAGDYQRLFARIDALTLLAAPGFEVVFDWRMQQERQLRESAGTGASAVMDEAGVARFIQHYERLTRHILAEMPGRADLTVRLDRNRAIVAFECGRKTFPNGSID